MMIASESSVNLKDSAWSWVVVVACMLINTMSGGLERSKGIMYIVFITKFGGSSAVIAYIFALVSTIRLCGGPIVGIMLTRWSCRSIVITGGCLFAISCIVTMFAVNIPYLFFSFGVLRGISGLFTYVPSIVVLSSYFDKHIALATGLTTAGIGLGSIILPPIIDYVSETYDFSGLFLIIGGMFLNIIPLALLLRPVRLQTRIVQLDRLRKKLKNDNKKDLSKEAKILLVPQSVAVTQKGAPSFPSNFNKIHQHSTSKDDNLNKINNLEMSSNFVDAKLETDKAYASDQLLNKVADSDCSGYTNGSIHKHNFPEMNRLSSVRNLDLLRAKSLQQIDELSVSNLKRYNTEEKIDTVSICMSENLSTSHNQLNDNKQKGDANNHNVNKVEHKSDNSEISPESDASMKHAVDTAKKKLCHFYLLKNPVFGLFCVSIMLTTMTIHTVMTFIPSFIVSNGLTQTDSAVILASYGAADVFSRIFIFGLGFDLPVIKPYRMWVYNFNQLLFAMITVVTPFLHTFKQFIVLSLFLGASTAGVVGPKSVIIVDILSAELLPYSFGILLLVQGLGTLTGAPSSGALYDTYKDYRIIFYYVGSLCFASFFIFLVGNIIFKKQHDSRQQLSSS